MKDTTIFDYDEETGSSYCVIPYDGRTFAGVAYCHPDDVDFKSERVGMSIAEARAQIDILRYIRDCKIKPALKTLRMLYSDISNSKYHNPKSRETKMLQRRIHELEKELATTNNEIADIRKFVKDYIDGKEKLYQRLRAKSNNN